MKAGRGKESGRTSSVLLVVHEKKLKLLDVADGELIETDENWSRVRKGELIETNKSWSRVRRNATSTICVAEPSAIESFFTRFAHAAAKGIGMMTRGGGGRLGKGDYLDETVGHQEPCLLVRPIPNLHVLGSSLDTANVVCEKAGRVHSTMRLWLHSMRC